MCTRCVSFVYIFDLYFYTHIICFYTLLYKEFFRGNLSKNPIGLASLKPAGASSGGGSSNRSNEPLVSDLRLHIAKDLQMEDSAEMLELLVANKILDMNLKLRVVQQVIWKKYVEENATSAAASGVAGAGANHQMISTGSGMSMIFSSNALLLKIMFIPLPVLII